MKKNLLIILIIIILVLVLGLFVVYRNGGFLASFNVLFGRESPPISGIILFYGDGCSHCANVDKFVLDNKIEEEIKFTRLEVFNNKENANILVKKANACGLPTDKIGVPFLWDGSKCILGDIDIIKFFENAK